MTNNPTIDGVSRDALTVLLETFKFAVEHGKQPTFSKGDAEFFIEQLSAVIAAPVVERQEPAVEIRSVISRNNGQFSFKVLDKNSLHIGTKLYTAPTQLAELQAENAKLLGMLGEWDKSNLGKTLLENLELQKERDELQATIKRQAALLREIRNMPTKRCVAFRCDIDAILNGSQS